MALWIEVDDNTMVGAKTFGNGDGLTVTVVDYSGDAVKITGEKANVEALLVKMLDAARSSRA